MTEQTAKELVVRAGQELVQSGLIARTWGNVSCRVDETTFVITPSGRPYETLKPEEVVLCKTSDASYEGDIKPSSEKGIHALVLRTHPDCNFVIHTHQPWASTVSAAGIASMPAAGYTLLGETVAVAAYGLPGTKALRNGVGNALASTQGHALMMAHHGALCFGKSYEETFSAARQLEDACRTFVQQKYLIASGAAAYENSGFYNHFVSSVVGGEVTLPAQPLPIFSSRRTPDGFVLEEEGKDTAYRLGNLGLPPAADIHNAIYESRKDICFITQNITTGLLAVSLTKAPLCPLLDDFAQIVGLSARCAQTTSPKDIVRALHGREGVLVPGGGALCCSATASDAHAVRLVMEKAALAQISTQLFGGGRPLSLLDCQLMHFVYTRSYAKKAKAAASAHTL